MVTLTPGKKEDLLGAQLKRQPSALAFAEDRDGLCFVEAIFSSSRGNQQYLQLLLPFLHLA